MEKEGGNRERMRKCRESISLHFLIFSPFPPHFLILSPFPLLFLILFPFPRSPAARLKRVAQPWLANGFKSYLSLVDLSSSPYQSYQGRKSQKSPAQAIVEGGRLIKGKQEISAITTWRKNIHKMSFKMPCHRYYRLPQTGVWRSRREVLAVGSGQRPSNSSIMDQSRHLTRSPQCSASTPLPLKRGKTE